jgi:protein gp37
MGDKSGIEWTDATWNPVTGCTKVSAGCKNCYAERVFPRAYGRSTVPAPGGDFRMLRKFTDVLTHDDRLSQPIRWKKPRKIFVNSMSDLFHEDVPFEFIDKVFAVMALTSQHTYQILTKRPERMLEYLESGNLARIRIGEAMNQPTWTRLPSGRSYPRLCENWPLPNVWLGCSVEHQNALYRIDTLKDIPAAVRFVSFEPLLEDLGALIIDRIHWAIVGGESGPGARVLDLAWVRSIVSQCKAQNVACFVKQLGADAFSREDMLLGHRGRIPIDGKDGVWRRLDDSKGGDIEEFPEDLRVREFPEVVHV